MEESLPSRLETHGFSLGAAESALPYQVKEEDSPYGWCRMTLQTSDVKRQGHPRDHVAQCWIACLRRRCDPGPAFSFSQGQ